MVLEKDYLGANFWCWRVQAKVTFFECIRRHNTLWAGGRRKNNFRQLHLVAPSEQAAFGVKIGSPKTTIRWAGFATEINQAGLALFPHNEYERIHWPVRIDSERGNNIIPQRVVWRVLHRPDIGDDWRQSFLILFFPSLPFAVIHEQCKERKRYGCNRRYYYSNTYRSRIVFCVEQW